MRKQTGRMTWMVLAAAAMAIGGASSARASDVTLVARVPFAFIVGDSRLPAGDYIIKQASNDGSVLSIATPDFRQFVFTLSIASQPDRSEPPELVFEKIDNQYFLSRVVRDGYDAREILLPRSTLKPELVAVVLHP